MSMIVEVALISAGLSLLLVILSKFLTNQTELKKVKSETEEYRKKIKEAQKEKNEALVKEYTNKMFKLSQGQFKYTTKNMMVSMIIVIFAFGWLGNTYGAMHIDLKQEDAFGYHSVFTGFLGEEKIPMVFSDSSNIGIDINKDSSFSDNEKFEISEIVPYKNNRLIFTEIKNNKTTADMIIAKAPFNMPYAGSNLTWFWIYLFITLPSTFIFRKLLDVQ